MAIRQSVRDALSIAVIATAALFVYRYAWPPAVGRDGTGYLLYYIDIAKARPTYPLLMTYRTPIAPLVIGGLIELGGRSLMSFAFALLYVAAVVATYAVGRLWSRWVGLGAALALLAHPGYAALSNGIASDPLFGAVFMIWAAAICWTLDRQTPRWYMFHAGMVVLLVLIRPVAQVFLAFALFPWVVSSTSHGQRLRNAATFLSVAALSLCGWASYNYFRYDDFTVSRGGGAIIPFYRLFLVERSVSPENGPASRELGRAVADDLLKREPYASYHISVQTFFTAGNTRMYADLLPLSDRTWGWDSDYAVLRDAALEALRAHPRRYLADVLYDFVVLLGVNDHRPGPAPGPARPEPAAVPVATTALAVPTEGQLIPYSYMGWLASTPEGTPRQAVRSPRFEHLLSELSSKAGSPAAARAFNSIGRLFPSMLVLLVVGGAAMWTVRVKARECRVYSVLAALALLALCPTVASQNLVFEYRIPFDPIFITIGVAGLIRTGGDSPEARAA